ncbi:hypothetical protein [Actinorhabdospora filicis]|uniref:hypothetical protein n=1 Tax=Actinorhabdospora filicis TaxID=1785913 RepID=UPI00255764EB|nr:hypothetical protein [Actinorhabdospora filicis]
MSETPARQPRLAAEPAWLPGSVEVHVVGESFHATDIARLLAATGPRVILVAVLVPAPAHSEFPTSVPVYVQKTLVGHIDGEISATVHHAILGFAADHGGRLPACPARIEETESYGPQVVLSLDPGPLGLSPELFIPVPAMAKFVRTLLPRLDLPQPVFRGADAGARKALDDAVAAADGIDADWDRPTRAWPRLEKTVREILDRLIRASDPRTGRAWLTLARTTRYQKGRRDDTLRSYVKAMVCDRHDPEAAEALFDYIAVAPYVPVLVALYARLPLAVRPGVLDGLVAMSYGTDRHGKLAPAQGERLRGELMALAAAQSDRHTMAVLAGDLGLRAEKAGDLPGALSHLCAAVEAGSADPKVADRLTVHLVRDARYEEAAKALRQSLAVPIDSVSLRDRLRKRLDRCDRNLAG